MLTANRGIPVVAGRPMMMWGLLSLLVLLVLTGWIYDLWFVLTSPFFDSALGYSALVASESKKTLQVLSALKALLALIGSGEIGISLVVDVQVTLGKMLTSLTHMLTSVYELTLLDMGVWKLFHLLLGGFQASQETMLSLTLALLLLVEVNNRLPAMPAWFRLGSRHLLHYVLMVFLATAVFFPLAIGTAGGIARAVTNDMMAEVNDHYQRLHDHVQDGTDSSSMQNTAHSVVNKAESIAKQLKDKVASTISMTTMHMAVMLFNTYIMPAALFLFMLGGVHVLCRPRQGQSRLEQSAL